MAYIDRRTHRLCVFWLVVVLLQVARRRPRETGAFTETSSIGTCQEV